MKKLKLFALLLLVTFVISPILHAIWIWAILKDEERAWKMFVSYDRFGNAGINGDPRITVSERAYFGMKAGGRGWCILCRILSFFQKNHCELVGNPAATATIQTSIDQATT